MNKQAIVDQLKNQVPENFRPIVDAMLIIERSESTQKLPTFYLENRHCSRTKRRLTFLTMKIGNEEVSTQVSEAFADFMKSNGINLTRPYKTTDLQ